MKAGVIGTGYVGLMQGTGLAEIGHDVVCIDNDAEKVARLQSGDIPIFEPGLTEYVLRNTREGRLRFSTDKREALGASAIFLALPTPQGGDGAADLSYVLSVADELGDLMQDDDPFRVIVNKSTVPVGTSEKVRAAIAAKTNAPFAVVSNPEFLREGSAVGDFMKPDRIIIGSN